MAKGTSVTPCPDDETLGALVEHGLAAAERDRVSAHIDECGTCREIVVAAVRGGAASAPTLLAGTPTVPALATPAPVPAGARIGRYEVRALLGAGGMGQVFEAYDGELDRAIALKVLRPELARSSAVLAERLVRESRLMAKVVHPAVITVHDVGRAGDAVFIAMELIRGETLGAYVARVRPSWREIVALYERAGEGLAAAHATGIVHRDFKPDNVLVERDAARVIVTDFGIARAAESDDVVIAGTGGDVALTSPGTVIGTPAYMAPEQLDGRKVDARADVFAFSASLWEALCGERPFAGTTPAEIRAAIEQRPRAPQRGMPRRVAAVLARGLARDPDERWPDLQAMLDALASARAVRRRLAIAASAAGLVGVGIAGALVLARSPVIDPCEQGAGAVANVYPRDALRSGLDRDPALRDRVVAGLDELTKQWRDTYVATCHADREPVQPPAVAACLEARRIELAGVAADIAIDGPAHAGGLRVLLGDPARCATPAPGMLLASVPEDVVLRRQVTALRYRSFDAEAARERGDFGVALPALQALVAEAATTWPLVHAEALYALGATQMHDGDTRHALKTLRDAAALAEAVHHDRVAAFAWAALVTASKSEQDAAARGLEYVTYAEAADDRLGRPPEVEEMIVYAKAGALVAADRTKEAEVAFTRAVALAEQTVPSYLPRALDGLAGVYENEGRYLDSIGLYRKVLAQPANGDVLRAIAVRERLATNLSALGQDAEAVSLSREAVALADSKLGDGNIERPRAHMLFASELQDAGQLGAAMTEVHAATREIARLQGERSVAFADSLVLEGSILVDLARYADAEPMFARACDIYAFQTGDGSSQQLDCWIHEANALAELRKPTQALVLADKVVSAYDASTAELRPDLADALQIRGQIHGKLHHHGQAVADLERAIAEFSKTAIEPGHTGAAEWALALEIGATEPKRASELAADAFAKLTAPSWAKTRAKVAGWQKAHP